MSGVNIREVPSHLFLPLVGTDNAWSWLQDGAYRLVPRTRPWVDARGAVSVRLVWRGPDRMSIVLCFRLRGSIPDDLLDALADAMMPHVTLDA